MAVAARYTKIWVDEFDFSGDSMSAVTSLQSPTVDATTFQQSGKVWQVIGPEGSISQSGYIMALGTDEMEEELYARLGSSGTHYVAALYGTTTTGCPAYVVPGTSVRNLQIQAPIDGILTINAEWVSGTGVKRGKRVFDGSVSATGGQTGVDFGSSGSSGGYAYLFVRGITGTASNASIAVESDSSSGFGTAAVEGTFSFSTVGSYAISLSGAIGRYIRVNVTSLGGASAIEFGCIVAVNGVTM